MWVIFCTTQVWHSTLQQRTSLHLQGVATVILWTLYPRPQQRISQLSPGSQVRSTVPGPNSLFLHKSGELFWYSNSLRLTFPPKDSSHRLSPFLPLIESDLLEFSSRWFPICSIRWTSYYRLQFCVMEQNNKPFRAFQNHGNKTKGKKTDWEVQWNQWPILANFCKQKKNLLFNPIETSLQKLLLLTSLEATQKPTFGLDHSKTKP